MKRERRKGRSKMVEYVTRMMCPYCYEEFPEADYDHETDKYFCPSCGKEVDV